MTLKDRLVATAGRGPGFDQIRLAAAATVLLHHCRLTQHDIRDPLFLYSGGFVHFGLLAVIVFFAISGFLVTPGLVRSGDLVEFCVNRILRIFPALFTVVIATMFCLGPVLTSSPPLNYFFDPHLYLYLKNILTLTYDYLPGVTERGGPVVANGALWTLHFEVLAYGALALMYVIGVLRHATIFLVMLLASYALYVSMVCMPIVGQTLPGRFVTFISLFIYFAVGSGLFVFRESVPFSGRLALIAFAILLVALPAGLGPALLPICLPYLIIFSGLSWLPGQSVIRRDLSYGVYLIHAPIVVAFGILFPVPGNWGLLAVAVAIVTLILSYFCRVLVEEPALRQKRALSRWINCRMGQVDGSVSPSADPGQMVVPSGASSPDNVDIRKVSRR